MSEYIRTNKFYPNECLNIFVQTKLTRMNVRKNICAPYIRIFEYSNILGTNIYSDIRSGQFCLYEYIRTFGRVKFVFTNIFGHSFMSVLERENGPNIRIFVQFSIRIFIRTFVRVKFFIQIYSDIHSCKFVDMNIFGYSFVSKFLRMSHSGS